MSNSVRPSFLSIFNFLWSVDYNANDFNILIFIGLHAQAHQPPSRQKSQFIYQNNSTVSSASYADKQKERQRIEKPSPEEEETK